MENTTAARRLAPSDVVVWDHNDRARRSDLRKLGTATRLVDRADPTNVHGRFTCYYHWHPTAYTAFATSAETANPEIADPAAPGWILVTQGASTGGRRYRDDLTVAEAQTAALAWLDRRFTAVDTISRRPVRAA